MKQSGLVYCATGASFARLAISSIESFFSQGGTSAVEVFTDKNGFDVLSEHIFSGDVLVRRLPNPELGFIDKISALESSSFSRGIFVDCDTFFPKYPDRQAGSIFETDVLRSLENFDLVVLPGFSLNVPRELQAGSAALGQWNTGVIGFNRTKDFLEFLASWRANYMTTDPHDQPSFRLALIGSKLRVGPLMPEYNFQGHGFLNAKPLIFHLTGNYRKNWLKDSLLLEKISSEIASEVYPAFFVEFQRVSPLPSKLTRTMGPTIGYFLRGIGKWVSTRIDIVTTSNTYHRNL